MSSSTMNFWLAAASLYQSIDRFLFFLRFFFKESSDFFFSFLFSVSKRWELNSSACLNKPTGYKNIWKIMIIRTIGMMRMIIRLEKQKDNVKKKRKENGELMRKNRNVSGRNVFIRRWVHGRGGYGVQKELIGSGCGTVLYQSREF